MQHVKIVMDPIHVTAKVDLPEMALTAQVFTEFIRTTHIISAWLLLTNH